MRSGIRLPMRCRSHRCAPSRKYTGGQQLSFASGSFRAAQVISARKVPNSMLSHYGFKASMTIEPISVPEAIKQLLGIGSVC
jgi:hypothetical protein